MIELKIEWYLALDILSSDNVCIESAGSTK
jgi:hypothetical protein